MSVLNNKVHLIDCMEFMRTCNDKQFDLAICDIQYGIDQGGGKNHTRTKPFGSRKDNKNTRGTFIKATDYKDYGDKETMPPEYHIELRRISKNQILFGANHFIDNIPEPKNSSCWIIWDKLNSGDFADCEIALTTFKTSIRIFRYKWNGMLQQKMKSKEVRIHPNQKPVDLYKWLLQNYAKPGQTIFDSHVGSGSIRIACHDLGFDFTGCELDPDYHAAQEKRFQEHIKQDELFGKDEIMGLIYLTHDK